MASSESSREPEVEVDVEVEPPSTDTDTIMAEPSGSRLASSSGAGVSSSLETEGADPAYRWDEEYTEDLEEPARTGKSDADWDTLRHIIKCRLQHNISKYLTRTPRPRTTPLAPASSVDSFASETPRAPGMYAYNEHLPSTPGGLVLPPWPPRPSRERNGIHPGLGAMPRPPMIGPAATAAAAGAVLPGLVDVEAMIGGKTLPSQLDTEEARQARDRIFKLLDGFEDDPPFTVQRIAELALHPFAAHKSLGKYLRAIEKSLLVTSTWEATGPTDESTGAEQHTLAFTASASAASTPLFSPIPFLVRNGSAEPENLHGFMLDGGRRASVEAAMEGVADGSGTGAPDEDARMRVNMDISADASETVRPRPSMLLFGDDADVPAAGEPSTAGHDANVHAGLNGIATASGIHHEPFMGRVDELDAGPILPGSTTSPGNATTTHDDPHALHSVSPTTASAFREGTGESGTMIPHGMSDRPQPISSTTTLPQSPPAGKQSPTGSSAAAASPLSPRSARKVAPLPRSTSMGNLADRFVKAEVLPAAVEESSGLHASSTSPSTAPIANGEHASATTESEDKPGESEQGAGGTAPKQRKLESVEA